MDSNPGHLMEFLNHNLTLLTFYLGLLVFSLTLVLLTIITLIHWRRDRWIDHSILFDKLKRPVIMSYIEGNTPKLAVIHAIEKEPTEAMNLLLDISRKLQANAQAQLLPIFEGLPDSEQEIEAIGSPHTKRRIAAAERLALLHNKASNEALLGALKDEVMAVRYSAACALAEHGRMEDLEPILLAFDAEHEINWYRLVEVTLTYGPEAVPVLMRVLGEPPGRYSLNILNVAIRALGALKAKQAIGPLINLLKHDAFSIRLNAAHALGDIGDPTASQALAELRHDPQWHVRFDAMEAMGKLHDESKIPSWSKPSPTLLVGALHRGPEHPCHGNEGPRNPARTHARNS